jgi:hypothetical protein
VEIQRVLVGKMSIRDNDVSEEETTSVENQPLLGTTRLRYPKSVFFIIVNEFCERFNYYGMRSEFENIQFLGVLITIFCDSATADLSD